MAEKGSPVAKALLICYRNASPQPPAHRHLELLSARILPDNIAPRPPHIVRTGQIVSAVFNPGAALRTDGASFCLGVLSNPAADWATPRAPASDGCYALFRTDRDRVELVADAAATRTTWYVLTDQAFIASTSQRAIVAALGDFEPDREACAWMLSSGSLGPECGWDTRLRRVPPGGRILLDRTAWQIARHEPRIDFAATEQEVAAEERQRRLQAAVDGVVRTLDVEYSRWFVPLSGGVDSRGLLLALRRGVPEGTKLRCVTWGRRSALEEPGNDARIARALAERLNVEHDFYAVEPSSEPRERLLERFLTAGEGRIGAIGGYLDGFDVWKSLYERGAEGVIRGDEAFGWKPVRSELDVRSSVQLTMLADFFDEERLSEFDLPEQRIPGELMWRPQESIATWRDRLYQQFRLPVMLAALTDLKTAYVDVLNPLLYSSVLEHARALPDTLRTDKKLWRDTVRAFSPDVPFAKRSAVASLQAFMNDPAMLEWTLDELGSERAARLLGKAPLASVRAGMEAKLQGQLAPTGAAPRSLSSRVARGLRRRAKKHLHGRFDLDPFVLAFRAVIASRMCALLHEDAAALDELP